MNNIHEEFLQNELKWFKSLLCEVYLNEKYIIVKSDFSQSEDFNFIFPRKLISENELYKIMREYKVKYLKLATSNFINLEVLEKMICLKTHDLNFKTLASLSNFRKLCHKKQGIWLSDSIPWKENNLSRRFFSSEVIPFTICFNQYKIGQVCLVVQKNNIGIYDLEIYKEFQNQGFGNKFMDELLQMNNLSDSGHIFIQTWKENIIAKHLYFSKGFDVINKYYYYTEQ